MQGLYDSEPCMWSLWQEAGRLKYRSCGSLPPGCCMFVEVPTTYELVCGSALGHRLLLSIGIVVVRQMIEEDTAD